MWYLVQVVKGNKYFEAESKVGNRVLISDSSDMVVAARAMGAEAYRFEARKGNETFVLRDFRGAEQDASISAKFTALAQQFGAIVTAGEG